MTDLRLIKHFEAVYRLSSFSKAADELRLTHSAITRSIKVLEENWDVTLFVRTTRTVEPTDAGKRLYPMAVDLLAFSDTVRRETVTGDRQIRLIGGPIAMDSMLPRAIPAYREQAPHVKIAADVMPPTVAVEELVQRRVHLLLFHTSTLQAMPHLSRIWSTEVMAEDYLMVFRPGHPIAAKDTSLETLLRYPWVFPGYDKYLDARMPDALREALRQTNAPQYNIYSPTACMNLSMESDILTVAPASLAAHYLRAGYLDARYVPQVPKYRVSAAMLKETQRDSNIGQFVDCLSEAAREIERESAKLVEAYR